jgi:hypothetical protein
LKANWALGRWVMPVYSFTYPATLVVIH